MERLSNELRRLQNEDHDVAEVLEAYEEIDRVYQESLKAMGRVPTQTAEVSSSARVKLSFRSDSGWEHD